MNKKLQRLVVILLAVAMLLTILLPALSIFAQASSSSDEVTEEDIDALEDELAEAKKRRTEAQQKLNSIRGDLSKAKQAMDLVNEQVLMTEQQISTTRSLITATQERIETTKAEILQTEQDIADSEAAIQESQLKLDDYDARISDQEQTISSLSKQQEDETQAFYDHVRWVEETGSVTYLAILLNSRTFDELLDQTIVINEAMGYTDTVLENLQTTQEDLAMARERLKDEREDRAEIKAQQEEQLATQEQQKADLIALQANLEDETVRLQASQTDLESQLTQLEKDKAEATALYNEIAASESEYAKEASALAAEEAAIQKALKEAETLYQDQLARLQNTGDWYWPLPGRTSLSSLFGGRYLFGKWESHTGTDIPAPSGTEIHAAQGGVVSYVSSNKNSSYGWYCMVSHGNGYVTLYAHQRVKPIVKVGQTVTKGQVLGYVGTTGNSTGNHLHFELRINGTRADILQLYPNMTFTMNGYSWKGNKYPAAMGRK